MGFTTAVQTVALMLAYSIPGYLMIKGKLLTADKISAFAVLLVYVCSPFQTVDAIQRIECSAYMTTRLFLTVAIGLVLMGGMMGVMFILFRKKQEDVKYRILTIAAAMGNCGFMGIPLLEAMLPDYPQAVPFATGFFLSMNILMWTLASAIITRDKGYIRVTKIILNPMTIAMFFSLIMYFAGIKLTGKAIEIVVVLSKFCTPLCMLILGMRLATVNLKTVFTEPMQYAATALKLIVFPLVAYTLTSLLPIEREYVQAIYLICAVPIANLVLSFAEMLGEGQETAANVVLLSTLLSIVTIPFMTLIVR